MRLLAALFFAITLFVAAPAPVLAQQEAATTAPAPSLAGTRWEGPARWYDGELKQWWVVFRADGVLEYGYEGNTYDNGRWTQNDQLVTWHTNNYFALYSGTVSASGMSGTMHNRRGWNGVWVFRPAG